MRLFIWLSRTFPREIMNVHKICYKNRLRGIMLALTGGGAHSTNCPSSTVISTKLPNVPRGVHELGLDKQFGRARLPRHMRNNWWTPSLLTARATARATKQKKQQQQQLQQQPQQQQTSAIVAPSGKLSKKRLLTKTSKRNKDNDRKFFVGVCL